MIPRTKIVTTEQFKETFGIRKQEAQALANEFNSLDEIVDFLEDVGNLSDLEGIGQTTSSRVFNWFKHNHEESLRRHKQDTGIATEFLTANELKYEPNDDEEFVWGYICPRCDSENPMIGDPAEFYGLQH